MNRLLTVIGTRPQYIKYAALFPFLRSSFSEILVDTGQHYDASLSKVFLDEFELPRPDYTLNSTSFDPAPQIGFMINQLHSILSSEKPDAVLCFGDTNSALAAALTAVKCGIRCIHIEAGERNFDIQEVRVPPWKIPEETNRITIDNISALLICASHRACSNLIEEHISGEIKYAGDIMYDLFLKKSDDILRRCEAIRQYDLESKAYYFCTVHRTINTDDRDRLRSIFGALMKLDKPVVIPLHPRTEKMLREYDLINGYSQAENLRIIPPVGYLDSLTLNCHAYKVITDSGGVMREAFFNAVPSICIDDTTAWIDICLSGWSVLTGAEEERILIAAIQSPPEDKPDLFGGGLAIAKTIETLTRFIG